MTTNRFVGHFLSRFLNRHALAIYFVCAYSITWLALLGLVGTNVALGVALTMADVGVMFLAMLAGPGLSGLVLTAVVDGRAGLADLWGRFLTWRVPLRWYAVAVLTVPTLVLVTLGTLALLVSPAFTPGFTPLLFAFGVVAGLVEEIGWTGFATPRLLKRFSPLTAGLVLGLLWATWHGMADFLGNIQTMGWLWPLSFVIYWLLPLTAYRVLMVWVYSHTRSLLLMQLMHAFYTGTLLVLTPAVGFPAALTWETLFTALLVSVAVGVAVWERTRQASPRVGTSPA